MEGDLALSGKLRPWTLAAAPAQTLAHGLRAPLGTLAGFAKALERALGDDAPPRSRHYVARILAAVGQLENRVEAVLSFARAAHAPLAAGPVELSAAAQIGRAPV